MGGVAQRKTRRRVEAVTRTPLHFLFSLMMVWFGSTFPSMNNALEWVLFLEACVAFYNFPSSNLVLEHV